LKVERQEGRLGERDIENVATEDAEGGGKAYIAMDLGLGVLEETRETRVEAHKMGTTSGIESDASSEQLETVTDGKGNVIGKHKRARGPEAHKLGTTSGSESDAFCGQWEMVRDEKGNLIWKHKQARGPEAHKLGTTSSSEIDASSGQWRIPRDEEGNLIRKLTRKRV